MNAKNASKPFWTESPTSTAAKTEDMRESSLRNWATATARERPLRTPLTSLGRHVQVCPGHESLNTGHYASSDVARRPVPDDRRVQPPGRRERRPAASVGAPLRSAASRADREGPATVRARGRAGRRRDAARARPRPAGRRGGTAGVHDGAAGAVGERRRGAGRARGTAPRRVRALRRGTGPRG